MTATKATILYIEDDPASRQLVERALKHAGYHVLVAERGLDGIDIARRECPDMILTDINLPDISGREVTMQKDEHDAVLTLPQPGAEESGDVHLVPVSADRRPLAARIQR